MLPWYHEKGGKNELKQNKVHIYGSAVQVRCVAKSRNRHEEQERQRKKKVCVQGGRSDTVGMRNARALHSSAPFLPTHAILPST